VRARISPELLPAHPKRNITIYRAFRPPANRRRPSIPCTEAQRQMNENISACFIPPSCALLAARRRSIANLSYADRRRSETLCGGLPFHHGHHQPKSTRAAPVCIQHRQSRMSYMEWSSPSTTRRALPPTARPRRKMGVDLDPPPPLPPPPPAPPPPPPPPHRPPPSSSSINTKSTTIGASIFPDTPSIAGAGPSSASRKLGAGTRAFQIQRKDLTGSST